MVTLINQYWTTRYSFDLNYLLCNWKQLGHLFFHLQVCTRSYSRSCTTRKSQLNKHRIEIVRLLDCHLNTTLELRLLQTFIKFIVLISRTRIIKKSSLLNLIKINFRIMKSSISISALSVEIGSNLISVWNISFRYSPTLQYQSLVSKLV